jgi:hypothetical protein
MMGVVLIVFWEVIVIRDFPAVSSGTGQAAPGAPQMPSKRAFSPSA